MKVYLTLWPWQTRMSVGRSVLVGCATDFDMSELQGPRRVIVIFGHGRAQVQRRVTGHAMLLGF